MFLEIGLVFMVLLFVTSCYVIWNLNTKLEALEAWIEDFINTIAKVQVELKKVDSAQAMLDVIAKHYV